MWQLKVLCLVLILLLTFFFALLPVFLASRIRRREVEGRERRIAAVAETRSGARTILSYLNCFSGGIFFGTCFIHLFPEVSEQCADVLREASLDIDYPIAELIISTGFFLIMLTEQCALSCCVRRLTAEHSDARFPERSTPVESDPLIRSSTPEAYSYSSSSRYGGHLQRGGDGDTSSSVMVTDPVVPTTTQGFRAIVVLIALSIHSLFAGLALGLQSTNHALWMLFAAIAIHKSAVAFTIGLQFVRAFLQFRQVLCYVLVFCVMSPIGIAIGTTVTALNNGSFALDVSSLTLQGLATGTFIYVTFFEILQKEFGAESYSIMKVLLLFIGFGTICLSKLFEG